MAQRVASVQQPGLGTSNEPEGDEHRANGGGGEEWGAWPRLARKKCRSGLPNEVGAPETGIRRNRDLLTPQAEHLKPDT
jgi:hypothetical protein